MQLDWFTVVAEIINFLILVFLLKRLLYDRILGIAEEREQEVASRYEEAEQKRKSAEEEKESYQKQRQEIEQRRESLLQEAEQEADQRRHEMLNQARTTVEHQQQEWFESLLHEQEKFLQKLHQQAGEQVYAVSRRVLSDLADANLERQVVDVFIERLKQISEDEVESIRQSLSENEAEIRSAFVLKEDSRQKISQALHDQIDSDLSPDFAIQEDLVCGVALRVDGRQISWNIDSYLDRLEQEMRASLEESLRHRVREDMQTMGEETAEGEDGQGGADQLEEKIEQKVRAVVREYWDEPGSEQQEADRDS